MIEETEQRKYSGQVIWKCECQCGNICFVSSSNLTRGYTKSCGCVKSRGEAIIKNILSQNNINFEV